MSWLASYSKPSVLGDLCRAALVAVAVTLFATGFDNYGFVFLGTPPPLYYVVGLLAAAVALTAYDARMPLPLLKSPFLLWIVFYFVLTSLWAVWMRSSGLVQQALDTRYRSIAFLAAVTLLFTTAVARRAAVVALAVVVVFVSCMYVAELMRLIQFQTLEFYGRVEGRSGGFYGNPNVAGMSIVLILAVVIGRIPDMWRLPLVAVGGIGVITTFSRGAQVCFGALVVVLAWRGHIRLGFVAILAICTGVLLLLTLQTDQVVGFLQAHELVNERTLLRLQFEAGDSGRTDLAMRALNVFLDSPLFGKGIGSTIDWDDATNSSHNQFLNLAGDHGVLGLLAFPALAVALVWGNPGAIPFAAVLMLAGFVSHNLLQDRGYLLVTALAASYAYGPEDTDAGPGSAPETDGPIGSAL